jgi:hypothetical protein
MPTHLEMEFTSRWYLIVIDLWLVGTTFNPKLTNNVKIHDNVVVKFSFNKVIQKLIPNHENFIQMHLEFRVNQNWDPPFAKLKNTKEYNFFTT